MQKYQNDELKSYIKESELVIINEDLRLRLSKDMVKKYEAGLYNVALLDMIDSIKQIKNLNIIYPSNAKPIFYIYVVPDDNFRTLLNYPSNINTNGGGKPVLSYDLDGFNSAYGLSNNMLENKKELSLMKKVNNVHEFAHLVHGMFFNKCRFISEGFAEAFTLYTLDYESMFDEHREAILEMDEEYILSAKQLIELSNNEPTSVDNFKTGSIIQNRTCSFDYSYISSYLFVRGCLEIIEANFELDRVSSTQKFLEIVKQSRSNNAWLVYDIASELGVDKDELLNGKKFQLDVIKNFISKKGKV